MKKIYPFSLILLCLLAFRADEASQVERKLKGTEWLLTQMTIDGKPSESFDASEQVRLLFGKDGIHTTTVREQGQVRKGPWTITNERFLRLEDTKSGDQQTLEILQLGRKNMQLKLAESESVILMYLTKS